MSDTLEQVVEVAFAALRESPRPRSVHPDRREPTRKRRTVRGLLRMRRRPLTVQCTGISASWCPLHGDCVCPRTRPDGDFDDGNMNDPSCPLHAPSSEHATYPRAIHVISHRANPQGRVMSEWWKCPNDPPCPHGSILHDVDEIDDPSPTCCADGCHCGRPYPQRDDAHTGRQGNDAKGGAMTNQGNDA